MSSPSLHTSQVQSNVTEADLSRLTGLIYDAALDLELWPTFLEQYAEAIGATCANTHAGNSHTQTLYYMSAFGVDPEALETYASYYVASEPWIPPATLLPAGSVVTSTALVTDEELESSEFYNDFLSPINIRHLCSLVVTNANGDIALTSAFRPKRKDDFGEPQRNIARHLWPHMKRAVQIRQRLITLESERDSVLGALEKLPVGVVLLNETGRIVLMNRSAQNILARNDGLAASPTGLRAATLYQTRQLRQLARTAAISGTDLDAAPGGLMTVSRTSGARPYSVLVTPIRLARFDTFVEQAAVAIFVTDPEQNIEFPKDALHHLYGLTPAEARLAEALIKGEHLNDIAERFGITKETARYQLKAIFSKTNTHSQSDLVRLVLSGTAGIYHE